MAETHVTCRVLELFAGIGGLRCAWPEATVVAAVDINQVARDVYLRNHSGPYHIREIASMRSSDFAPLQADTWWLSPPCQPYCQRGKRRDQQDVRAGALARIVELIPEFLPNSVAVENVPGFEISESYRQLLQVLKEAGYQCREIQLCPTQLNWPNRRTRFYLLASRQALTDWRPFPVYDRDVSQMVSPHISRATCGDLWLPNDQLQRFTTAIDRIRPQESRQNPAACFASSYGKAIVGSGSYVAQDGGYRRFAPQEVAQLLGFPASFSLGNLSCRASWRLLGNSLSLPAVRYVISHLPRGPTLRLPWLASQAA